MSASSPTAYLLIAHGSRDPRPQAAMNRLAQLVRDQLRERTVLNRPNKSFGADLKAAPYQMMTAAALVNLPTHQSRSAPAISSDWDQQPPYPIVGTAYLECTPLPLHQQVYEFCVRVKAAGVERVKLVPIFLLRGVHVVEDIPQEVALAREQLAGCMAIDLCTHLGSHSRLGQVLKAKVAATASKSWLLLAHGSRQPGGNDSVEALAQSLSANVAFWSVSPDLESQVVQLMQSGCQQITIMPYFLFTGGITDAITRVTEELAERFPRVNFRLLPPLGATVEVARLTAEIALDSCSSSAGAVIKPMKRMALRH
ncbi:sirohydrochlorin chelatase [Pseudanabaena sp. FACHB-2040]|uniref:sirohydrochlorin chelatase n=1 Tax=Pseudanabaena sp. FACHB-2040 TaxID=2692859 RepID=UPI0016827BE2|nr:sirohydrochlorin chelatase [Pseudanabaena sp. FACHB-2040]